MLSVFVHCREYYGSQIHVFCRDTSSKKPLSKSWFFLGFGCVAVPEGLISQCAAIWIRTAKMNVTDEHMGFVSDSHVHFCGE